MPGHRNAEEIGLAAMLVTHSLALEVNLGECVTRMPPLSMNKAAHSGFEIQKSKAGVSVAPQKGFMPFKNLKKKVGFYFMNSCTLPRHLRVSN